jgi:hypothetical protein
LHRVAFQLYLVFQPAVRRFAGLGDAATVGIIGPAVIGASQTPFHRIAGGEFNLSVGASAVDQANLPVQILVEHQVFAEQSDRNDFLLP